MANDVLGELEIRIRGNLDDLDKDFGSAKSKALGHVDDIAEKSKAKVGSAMKGIAGIGSAIAGAFAGIAAGKFLGGAIDELQEAQKVGAQTTAVITSTGGAANVTAKHVDSLSNSLSLMSGKDDEYIASGENMLLTFTNIKNGVGKGNDVFDQATKATLDMSVAMGTDMSQAAIQVGKALNDPIKGVTALQRVGVTFTAQQKDQIKAMVAAGDTMGAQKLILAELNKEFGGSAKAQATSVDRMKVAWANLEESAGRALAPVVGGLASLGARVLPAVADKVESFGSSFVEAFSFMRDGGKKISDFNGVAGKLGATFALIAGGAKQLGSVLFKGDFVGGGPFEEDSPLIAGLFRFRDVITGVVHFVQDNAKPVFIGLGAAVLTFVVPPMVAWATSTIAAVAPILAVVAAVGILVGGIVYAYQHFSAFRTAVDLAWQALQIAWGVIVQVAEAIGTILAGAFEMIRGLFNVFAGLFSGDWGRLWDGIQQVFSGAWEAMLGFLGNMPSRIASAAVGLWDGIKDAFRSAINWIIEKWNNLRIPGFELNINLPGPIPDIHFGWGGMSLPDIPYLASGGIVPATHGGRLALLGEGGHDEAVVPLPSGYRSPRDRLGSMGSDGGRAPQVNVYVDGSLAGVVEGVRVKLSGVGRHNVDAGVKTRNRR